MISFAGTPTPPPFCTAHSSPCAFKTTMRDDAMTASSSTSGSTINKPSCSAKNPNFTAIGR
eukprot:31542-Pelagococcus_subviridis.AAC.5